MSLGVGSRCTMAELFPPHVVGWPSTSRRFKLCVDCSMTGGRRNIYILDITIESGRHLLASSVLAGARTIYYTTNVSFVAWVKFGCAGTERTSDVILYVPAGVPRPLPLLVPPLHAGSVMREKLSARPASVAALLQTPVNAESSAQSSQHLSRRHVVSTVVTVGVDVEYSPVIVSKESNLYARSMDVSNGHFPV